MARELYFVYNGKRYECGTVIICRHKSSNITYEVVFLCYNDEFNTFTYQGKNGGPLYSIDGKNFYDNFVGVKDEVCESIRDKFLQSIESSDKKNTLKEELMNDNILIAWIWYIFIMCIAIIFHWRVVIWLAATYIFIDYRNKELRK